LMLNLVKQTPKTIKLKSVQIFYKAFVVAELLASLCFLIKLTFQDISWWQKLAADLQ
jgi:hypothetical protein